MSNITAALQKITLINKSPFLVMGWFILSSNCIFTASKIFFPFYLLPHSNLRKLEDKLALLCKEVNLK